MNRSGVKYFHRGKKKKKFNGFQRLGRGSRVVLAHKTGYQWHHARSRTALFKKIRWIKIFEANDKRATVTSTKEKKEKNKNKNFISVAGLKTGMRKRRRRRREEEEESLLVCSSSGTAKFRPLWFVSSVTDTLTECSFQTYPSFIFSRAAAAAATIPVQYERSASPLTHSRWILNTSDWFNRWLTQQQWHTPTREIFLFCFFYLPHFPSWYKSGP